VRVLVSNNIIRFITFPVVSLYTIRSASFYVSVNTISGFIKCIIKFSLIFISWKRNPTLGTGHRSPSIDCLPMVTGLGA